MGIPFQQPAWPRGASIGGSETRLSLEPVRSRLVLMMKEIAPRISVDDQVHHGKPVLVGTRVPVDVVLSQLAAGIPVDEVAQEYGITRDDVLACLSYAAQLVEGEEVRATP